MNNKDIQKYGTTYSINQLNTVYCVDYLEMVYSTGDMQFLDLTQILTSYHLY